MHFSQFKIISLLFATYYDKLDIEFHLFKGVDIVLKKILDQSTCGNCRVCCVFDKSDVWELPLLTSNDLIYAKAHYNGEFIKRGDCSYVFDVEFKENGLAYCPMLTEKGCILGENKPFDCKIWPFRVNNLKGTLVITLSPVCRSVSSLPLNKISDFVNNDGFADMLFAEASKNPDMIKPYISGYPILAAKS